MTNVAYLTSEYPAPSHTFIAREIAALRRKGRRVIPFSIRQTHASGASDEAVPTVLGRGWLGRGVKALLDVLRHPIRGLSTWRLAQAHRPPGVAGWVWSQFHFGEAMMLAGMLRRAEIGHLHCHFANSGATVGMLASHFSGIPWSLTLHGISETDYPAGLLLADKLKRARFVACASWFIRAQALRVVPYEIWPKLHLVRCGIEPSAFPPRSSILEDKVLELVTIGRLSPEKGQFGLLEVLELLVAEGTDVNLTIVGDGPLRNSLESAVNKRGLSNRVLFRGALSENETIRAIAAADVFVLPSLMEGLPVVLMEAMAMCKPVVAPGIAGIPELVENGVTGLLFRPGNWTQLAECVSQIAAEPSKARGMAKRGRMVVLNEFDVDVAVEPLLRLFGSEEA